MASIDQQTNWWWLESRNTARGSTWLRSTLGELNEKTRAMLKLIVEDADSFAQRAEMYYKKRPQLISMVEDFYRVHRSLAERFDLLKSDSGARLVTTVGSPYDSVNRVPDNPKFSLEQGYDSYSETCYPEESSESEEGAESEVDDPEEELIDCKKKEEELPCRLDKDNEAMKLREELEKLREENKIQEYNLKQKDEEKREVIRQLSLALDMLKEENETMRKFIAARKSSPRKQSLFEFDRFKDALFEKLFHGTPKRQPVEVPLTMFRR